MYSVSCGRQILKPIPSLEEEFVEYKDKKSGGILKIHKYFFFFQSQLN